MDIKQLYYFTTIVNEGTISGAAKKLHITQPPLSVAIRQLEAELGITLFHRGSRKIVLTDPGKLLYKKGNNILKFYEDTLELLQDFSNGILGSLRIGIISSTENFFLNEIAYDFHEKNPEIKFEITEGNTFQMLERLEDKSLEVAIVRTPYKKNELEGINLASEHMIVVGKKEFFTDIDSDCDSIDLHQLACKPLILYRRWLSILKNEFKKENIIPNIVCINDDVRTSVSWVEKGLGLGIMPESGFAMIQADDIICKHFVNFDFASNIVCLFTPPTYRSPATEAFYLYLKEQFEGSQLERN